MAGMVSIKFDKAQLRRIEKQMNGMKGAMPTVMYRGINKTLNKTRTDIGRKAKENSGLKLKDIRKAIKVEKAKKSKLSGAVDIAGSRIPQFKFKGKKGRKRVYKFEATPRQSAKLFGSVFRPKHGGAAMWSTGYQIKQKRYQFGTYAIAGETKQIYPGVFFAIMKSGHKGFFFRDPNSKAGRIHETYGPSVGGLMEEQKAAVQSIRLQSQANLIKNIEVQVTLYLEKKAGTLNG